MRVRWILLCGCIVGIVGFAWFPGSKATLQVASKTQGVEFELTANGDYTTEIEVVNNGNRTALIREIRPGCGCISVSVPSYSVAPGKLVPVRFTVVSAVASESVLTAEFERGAATLSASCTIVGDFIGPNSEPGSMSVSLSGTAQLPVRVSAGYVHLGEVPETSDVERRSFNLEIASGFEVRASSSGASGIQIVEVRPSNSDHGTGNYITEFEAVIRPSLLRKADNSIADIQIPLKVDCLKNGANLMALRIPAWVKVVPEISINPSRLVIGPILVGETSRHSLELRSHIPTITSIEEVAFQDISTGLKITGEARIESGTRITVEFSTDTPMSKTMQSVLQVRTVPSNEIHTLKVPITVVAKTQWRTR